MRVGNLEVFALLIFGLLLGLACGYWIWGAANDHLRMNLPRAAAVVDNRNTLWVDGYISGVKIRFMVDTGAGYVGLTADMAHRLALLPTKTLSMSTAAGITEVGLATVGEIRVGGISVRDVPVTIMPPEVDMNMLGMSFLSRLSRFEYSNGKLILEQ